MQPASPNKTLLIIGLAILSGATMFLGIALGLPFLSPAEYDPGGGKTVQLLSLVHGGLLFGSLAASKVVLMRLSGDGEREIVRRHIVRWALLEGAALFGAVVILLAGIHGILPDEPLYYANAISYFVLAAVVGTDLLALGGSA